MSHDDASSAIDHFGRVVDLAERLRPLGVAVYRHDWLCLIAGSWLLVAGVRHQSYRFTWDGREGFIDVTGPFHVVHGDAAHAPRITSDRLGLGPAVDPLMYVANFFQSHDHPPAAQPPTRD